MVISLIKKAFRFGFEKTYDLSYEFSSKVVGLVLKDPLVDYALQRMRHVAEDQGISMFDLSLNQFCWSLSELLKNKELVKRIPDDLIWNHHLMMRIYVRAKMYERYLSEVASELSTRGAGADMSPEGLFWRN